MDTGNQYNNILKAIGQADKPTENGLQSINPSDPIQCTPAPLTLEQKARNYQLFDKLMKDGVDLSALVEKSKQTDDLQRQVESMKKADVDSELFSIMENAVKGDESVKLARQKASEIKSKIITEICLKNPEYAEALHEYRRAVNSAYIAMKESKKE